MEASVAVRPRKSGKPANASDSEIALRITQGLSNSEVARALHVDRKRVAKIRELQVSLMNPPSVASVEALKTIVRLEMSQEEAINEFSDQLAEYTQNYKLAMERKDEDTGQLIPDLEAAGRWAVLRLRLLEMMIRISGLDKKCELPEKSPQEALSCMTDEEVEARARAILASRQ